MPLRRTEIAGISITEDTELLCVGTDSLMLSAYVRANRSAAAVELGAGNGIISLLLLARDKIKSAHAIELEKAAADLCMKNAEDNGFSDRLRVLCEDVRNISFADHIGTSIVVTNPPYMKTESGKQCKSRGMENARHEHNGDIYDFCKCAAGLLKTGGSFYLVYRPDRLSALVDALTGNRLTPKRMTFVHSDEKHSPSSVLVEARKDGASSVYITPPLLLKRDGVDTEDAVYIYENGAFPKKFLAP